MRALVQRVCQAEVSVAGRPRGRIGKGLLVYVGVAPTDTPADAASLAEKVAHLRIFPDEAGKLNRSVQEMGGGVLVIPNFSLQADARKGRRPSFNTAAPAEVAQPLHEAFVAGLRAFPIDLAEGVFGADMTIRSDADGPINLIVDIPPV